MPVTNSDVSAIFEEVADLLDIQGANRFRVRAYREAAQTVSSLSRSVADLVADGEDLTELSGIGDDLAGKIAEIVDTGKLGQLEELEEEMSPELARMLRIPGLGPKRVKQIRDELGIETIAALEKAAKDGKIAELEGFGDKTQQKIVDGIDRARTEEQRTLLMEADQVVDPYLKYLEEGPHVGRLVVAGSYRRRKETVGDLDVLAISEEGEALIEHFVAYDNVADVISEGETRSSVVLRSGLQVDLRVVEEESYGAALLYFTGSKAHNVALRKIAVAEEIKINEYGVFDVSEVEESGEERSGEAGDEEDAPEATTEGERIAGETEEEIYELFEMPYIAPELRENRGELETAREGELPDLVAREDLRGDLHVHTTASDGAASLEEMAEKAAELGYEYLAVSDHSDFLGVYNGLDAERLAKQGEEIDALNEELGDLRLLKASEVDIKKDGSLALEDEAMEKLDLVVASVHTGFDLSEEDQTERIIRAMDNPHVHLVGHPTGRRINEREPYAVDVERLIEAAEERGVFLELNSQPDRLDLADVHVKYAREEGLLIPVNTDAHDTHHLDFIQFGIDQARRAWLEAGDVLNTRSWSDLKKLLKR